MLLMVGKHYTVQDKKEKGIQTGTSECIMFLS